MDAKHQNPPPCLIELLKTVFDQCDEGWILEKGGIEICLKILFEMDEVDRVFVSSFGRGLDTKLINLISEDIDRFRPLVKAFTAPMTAPIRTMIYCVLNGAQVKSIQYKYIYNKVSNLKISVKLKSGDKATFESNEFFDLEAVGNFGLIKFKGKPVIDWYYE